MSQFRIEQQAKYVKRMKELFGDVQNVPMFIGTTDEKFFAKQQKEKDSKNGR